VDEFQELLKDFGENYRTESQYLLEKVLVIDDAVEIIQGLERTL